MKRLSPLEKDADDTAIGNEDEYNINNMITPESKENKQQRCDYSFIAALYDHQSGLYKEVYFPIIRYSVMAIFNATPGREYFETESIYDYIKENFGLTIPQVVLQKVIYSLAEKYPKEITVYGGDTTTFQVKKPWDMAENKTVVEKTKKFNEQLAILENKYKEYIDAEGLNTDTTFVGFISDNTEDVLGYFESKVEEEHIDENYFFLTNFLQRIEQTDKEAFEAANKLFWGSIIAGFLRRENPSFSSSDIEKDEEYFLDTPIALSLLDLSTEKHHQYALDTISLLNKSGRSPRIHPITLKEMRSILQKVENNGGPFPNSDIASAYDRRGLKPSTLARIRINIEKDLKVLGVALFPSYSEQSVQGVIRDMKGEPMVEKLKTLRSEGYISFGTESWYSDFREIHDIFMYEYVRKRGEETGNKVRFVTLNDQLVGFVKDQADNYRGEMINPNRITLNLWMHNSISVTAANNLTEVLTRCQIQGESDLRRKLGIVSKYYNEDSPSFDLATYKSIILSIFRRDREVIGYIDEIEENDKLHRIDENKMVIVKVGEASLRSDSLYQAKNGELLEQIEELKINIRGLNERLDSSSSDNAAYSIANNELNSKVTIAHQEKVALEQKLEQRDEEIQRKDAELAAQKCINALQEERMKLNDDLDSAKRELSALENDRDSSVRYGKAVPLFLIYALVVGIILLLTVMFWHGTPMTFDNWQTWTGSISLLFVLFGAASYAKYLFAPRSLLSEIKRDYQKRWEESHPDYAIVSKRVACANERIKVLEEELKRLKK